MRKRIYIAGPLSSSGDLCQNINNATAVFVALAKAGFAPMCPHWSCYSKPCHPWRFATHDGVMCEASPLGNEELSHADWMGIDLAWVAVSDALLRLPGESKGADMEVECARENGVPVFGGIEAIVQHFSS